MAVKPSFDDSVLDCVINKHRTIGSGAYGAVYEASYQELPCAAKVLHSSLFEVNPASYKKLVERFEQECKLLSKIRHPCIVQFLGITRDPGSRLPILVMELLDENLTRFLERSTTEIPFHLQVNFSHDVALALAYMHSLGIIHRDLSSNNVLLIAGSRAKVSDFGMSDLISHDARTMQTSCPGTQVYMAPECMGEAVTYSQSIDCFSLGVLIVQIITRKFPNPGPRLDEASLPVQGLLWQQMRHEKYMRVVPETARRQNHLSLIDETSPLKPILMACLSDKESARPHARDVCRSLCAIKESHQLYSDSIENSSDYQFAVLRECDATRDELQSTASALRKTRSEVGEYQQANYRLQLQNRSLEQHVSELNKKVQELEIKLIEAEDNQQAASARGGGGGGFRFNLFGGRDRENVELLQSLKEKEQSLQDKNIQLKKVHSNHLFMIKRVEALQEELAQKNRDIDSKNREVRSKSERIQNLIKKMDALEVELGTEQHRSSSLNEELQSKIEELEETRQSLEGTSDNVSRLERQVELIESDQKSLEEARRLDVSHRDDKLQELSKEIKSLKKALREKTESLENLTERLGAKSDERKNISERSKGRHLAKILRDLIMREDSNSDSEGALDSLEESDPIVDSREQGSASTMNDVHSAISGKDCGGSQSPVPKQELSLSATFESIPPSASIVSKSRRSNYGNVEGEEAISDDDDLYRPPEPPGENTDFDYPESVDDLVDDQCDDSCQLSSPKADKVNIPSCQVYGQSSLVVALPPVVLIPSPLTPTRLHQCCSSTNVSDHTINGHLPPTSTVSTEGYSPKSAANIQSHRDESIHIISSEDHSINSQEVTKTAAVLPAGGIKLGGQYKAVQRELKEENNEVMNLSKSGGHADNDVSVAQHSNVDHMVATELPPPNPQQKGCVAMQQYIHSGGHQYDFECEVSSSANVQDRTQSHLQVATQSHVYPNASESHDTVAQSHDQEAVFQQPLGPPATLAPAVPGHVNVQRATQGETRPIPPSISESQNTTKKSQDRSSVLQFSPPVTSTQFQGAHPARVQSPTQTANREGAQIQHNGSNMRPSTGTEQAMNQDGQHASTRRELSVLPKVVATSQHQSDLPLLDTNTGIERSSCSHARKQQVETWEGEGQMRQVSAQQSQTLPPQSQQDQNQHSLRQQYRGLQDTRHSQAHQTVMQQREEEQIQTHRFEVQLPRESPPHPPQTQPYQAQHDQMQKSQIEEANLLKPSPQVQRVSSLPQYSQTREDEVQAANSTLQSLMMTLQNTEKTLLPHAIDKLMQTLMQMQEPEVHAQRAQVQGGQMQQRPGPTRQDEKQQPTHVRAQTEQLRIHQNPLETKDQMQPPPTRQSPLPVHHIPRQPQTYQTPTGDVQQNQGLATYRSSRDQRTLQSDTISLQPSYMQSQASIDLANNTSLPTQPPSHPQQNQPDSDQVGHLNYPSQTPVQPKYGAHQLQSQLPGRDDTLTSPTKAARLSDRPQDVVDPRRQLNVQQSLNQQSTLLFEQDMYAVAPSSNLAHPPSSKFVVTDGTAQVDVNYINQNYATGQTNMMENVSPHLMTKGLPQSKSSQQAAAEAPANFDRTDGHPNVPRNSFRDQRNMQQSNPPVMHAAQHGHYTQQNVHTQRQHSHTQVGSRGGPMQTSPTSRPPHATAPQLLATGTSALPSSSYVDRDRHESHTAFPPRPAMPPNTSGGQGRNVECADDYRHYGPYGADGGLQFQQRVKTAPLDYRTQLSSDSQQSQNASLEMSRTSRLNARYGQHQGPPMSQRNAQGVQQIEYSEHDPRLGLEGAQHPQRQYQATQSQGSPIPYGNQSSVSSEESFASSPSASSLGYHPSPQSSYDSQQSLPNQYQVRQRGQSATAHDGSRQPPNRQGEHWSPTRPPQRRGGSERLMSHPGVHTPTETGHRDFPNLSAENQKARHAGMGQYAPPPDRSLHPSMRPLPAHYPPNAPHPYHRSISASNYQQRSYPRTRSEPRMNSWSGRGRRPRRQPSATWTAPVRRLVQVYVEPSYGPRPQYVYEDELEQQHHYRYTQQHYLEYIDEDSDYANGEGLEGYDEYDELDEAGRRPQETFNMRARNFAADPYSQPGTRHAHRTGNHGNERPSDFPCIPQPSRQSSSKSESADSSVSLDSPRAKSNTRSADTYDDVYISQHKEELVRTLGKSEQAEEYSVVLMQPEYVDDLNLPWTAIFAVCRRHPNCINALLDRLQNPNRPKYSVAHISIVFDSDCIMLDIPTERAEKQGYAIASDVSPCMIKRKEATPPHESFGPHADSCYPPRHRLTITPQRDVSLRQSLKIDLKLIGAKDCVRHFVLKSPQLLARATQQHTQVHTRQHTQVHTPLLSPPPEKSTALQGEPDETRFLYFVGGRINHKWRGLGAYLGVPEDEIGRIAHNYEQADSTCAQCLTAVFNYWKNHQTDRQPTWNDLILAVTKIDMSLAQTMTNNLAGTCTINPS